VKVCEDFLFWVLKKGAQKVKVILGKCIGGGVEIVNFFSIDYERSMVYIYIFFSLGGGGLEKHEALWLLKNCKSYTLNAH
jgi:hypothetical protein